MSQTPAHVDQQAARDRAAYWFPAHRYGYGWGLGRAWQGWAVVAAELATIGLVQILFGRGAAALVALLVVLPVGTLVALKHGEPLRWRWGGA